MNNITDDVIELEKRRFINLLKPTITMLMVFGVLGVIGNAIILIVYWKLVKMTTTQFLIFVIAIFDFLTALVAVPIYLFIKVTWENNLIYCKLGFATIDFFINPGTFLLFIVTLVRYCHVCRPHLLHWIEPKMKVICVSIILIALFYSIVDVFSVSLTNQNKITGRKSLICNFVLRDLELTQFALVFFRIIIFILTMSAIVIFNVLVIIQNHKTKVLKQQTSQTISEESTATVDQDVDVERINSNNEFFKLVNENKSQNATSSVNTRSYVDKSDITLDTDLQNFTSKTETVTLPGEINTDMNFDHKSRRLSTKKNRRFVELISEHSFRGLSKTSVMLSFVSIVYVISFLPYVTMTLTGFDHHSRQLPVSDDVLKYVVLPLDAMYYLNCAANPVIYTFVNPNFRSRCRALFRS